MALRDVVRSHKGGKSPRDRLAEGEAMLADRVLGMRYSDLCAKYGVSMATLNRRLNAAVQARLAPTVDAYREQQNALLDELMAKHRKTLEAAEILLSTAQPGQDVGGLLGNRTNALNGMLRVAERRAKLNGLDMPQRVEVSTPEVTAQEKEMRELLDRAAADQAAREATIIEGEVVE